MNMKHTVQTTAIISFLAAILLVVGCLRLPIGYYIFLRITVFFVSIVLILVNREKGFSVANIVTILLGILFNPIIPVYLHNKTTWIAIDALAAAWFAYLAIISMKKSDNSQ